MFKRLAIGVIQTYQGAMFMQIAARVARIGARAFAWGAMSLGALAACHRASQDDSAQALQRAAMTYAAACARCHGTLSASGVLEHRRPAARDFSDAAFQASRSDAQLKQTIMHGFGSMPAFGDDLSAEQLDGLVKYVRSLNAKSTH